MIRADQLKAFAPIAMQGILDAFEAHAAEIAAAGLTTPQRVRHFMAQIATESGGLSRLEENLNYSDTRLMQVWPKRFPSRASTIGFAHNPHALANKVYGGRGGNHLPDDGWTFRGSGLMQTTFRDNFRAAGHENDPDTLRQPVGALLSALKYWSDHNLNALADKNDLKGITLKVNGGLNGLADRQAYLTRATKAFAA